jgi:cytoskeletal protein CcmA (bactofilin family)
MFRRNKKLAPKPAAKKNLIPSIVTREFNIIGNIISDGSIDFDGSIEGNIRCQTFILRENGNVKGEITADEVMVYGKLSGLIRARNVQLFSGSNIEGIVMHESITIEDGAFLDGKCKRTDKPIDSTGAAAASGSDESFKALENIRLISG